MSKVQLPVRFLAELNQPDVCPRCWWIRAKWGPSQPLPYHIPLPGVFSSIDSHIKQVVHEALRARGRLPRWFPGLGNAPITGFVEPLSWQTWQRTDDETGIALRGAPDDVFRTASGVIIVDYKTARKTSGQDELYPLYEAQLNAYAFIAEHLGHKVEGLWLVYAEPLAGHPVAEDQLVLSFRATPAPVQHRPELVRELLQQAAELLQERSAPRGRRGCSDCDQLRKFLKIARPSLMRRFVRRVIGW